MIPVPESELSIINIQSIQDVKYKRLLQNQFVAIKKDWEQITKTASNLYSLCEKNDAQLSCNNKKIKDRCCNFKALEVLCDRYKKNNRIIHNNKKP